jgi:endoglucanase
LSGEQVRELDLSSLSVGRYRLLVPGLGVSAPFSVGGAGVTAVYRATSRAFYHQRCGQELAEPHTTFAKPACHLEVYESGYLVGNPRHRAAADAVVRRFVGGYHDAGDHDCFTYHLRATDMHLTAYEMAPAAFADGDLNIPESGNGRVDILDEADWALAFYRQHQAADGAVPKGRGNDQDFIRDWERKHRERPPFGLIPATRRSNFEYAAVAAQYARLLKPVDAKTAAASLSSARRAYTWGAAQSSGPEKESDKIDPSFQAWAAAALFAATGDATYHAEVKRLYAAGALTRVHWRLRQYAPMFQWPYLRAGDAVDPEIRAALIAAIRKHADAVVANTEGSAYRMGHTGTKGLGWGNGHGGGFYADPCLRAWWLTGEQQYLDTASLNADFQLGTNPLSKTFISGIGVRPPTGPQLAEWLYAGAHRTGDTVAGIPVYGLAGHAPPGYPAEIPPWRRWRDLGNGGAEISSEFTITETVGAAAMLYATLYAAERGAHQ